MEIVFIGFFADKEVSHDWDLVEKLVNAFAQLFGGKSAELLLGMFVAFDCTINQNNVYERCLLLLVKLGKVAKLKSVVLECLRSVIETLRDHLVSASPITQNSGFGITSPLSEPSHERPQSVDPTTRRSRGSSSDFPGHMSLQDARQRKQALEEAIALFNEKPNKGVQRLASIGFIESSEQGGIPSAESIARFLLAHVKLDKKAIGDYLGENTPLSKAVLSAFAGCIDFKSLTLVEGMRKFLETFRLPGEGQKIDRILEQFASKYYRDNPAVFSSADVAYILSFSLIMLNTDLHSEKVKKKIVRSHV